MNIHQKKDLVQQKALSVIENDVHHRAKLYLATGVGKSRIPILYIQKYDLTDICLIVPTTTLRDQDWPNEFRKWGAEKYLERTTRVCLKSCHKIVGKTFRLVILDEGHNIGPKFLTFLSNNRVGALILLTATKPTRGPRASLIEQLKIKSEYVVTLPQAREMGLVAPYKIHVIYTELDKDTPYINVAKKNEPPILVTEQFHYDRLCKNIDMVKSGTMRGDLKFHINNRMHFIYYLKSKQVVVKWISDNLPKEDKILIFVGNQFVAKDICNEGFHAGITAKEKKKNLANFNDGTIKRLICVKSLNEGSNLSEVDSGIIGQVTSEEKDLIQRLGRFLRIRDGHYGNLYIVVAKNTQDEIWLRECLVNFPKEDIINYTLNQFVQQYGVK